ncbi:MAG: outer membrane protein [Planctomycetota bacterium]|jgi:opacity protein-like surface antigen
MMSTLAGMGKYLLPAILLLGCAAPLTRHEAAMIYRETETGSLSTQLTAPASSTEPGPPQYDAPPWQPRFALVMGWRNLSDDDSWKYIENQFATGIEFDLKHRDFPVGIEIGMAASFGYDEDPTLGVDDLWGSVYEFYMGPRLTLLEGRFHPFAAAGITFMGVDQEADVGIFSVSDDDSSVAGYVHGGAYFQITPQLDIGTDVRYVYGSDIDLFGFDGDADYFQISLLMGVRF